MDLPDGWIVKPLGELAEYINGRAFKPEEWETAGRPILRIQNLTRSSETLNRFSKPVEEKFIVHDGELLISWSATLGVFIYRGEEAVLNQHIFKVLPKPTINKLFLFYLVEAYLDELKRKVHGSGMQHITKGRFEESSVPIPPLSEQERIVARVETLFTRLDAGVAALKHAQAALKRYRASVLKAACEGRLVPQDPNDEPAEELLKRILAENGPVGAKRRFAPAEGLPPLPPGWCWAQVKQVGNVQLGRQRAPEHHSGPFMRPYLRVANVFEDRIDKSDVMEMNFTPNEYKKYQLHNGDILLNEGQSPELLGRPAIYRDEVPGACFQNTLIRFQANSGLLPEYALSVFRHYMHSGRFQKLSQITTNIAHLSAGRFGEIEFPLPPSGEQIRICTEVDYRFSIIKNIENGLMENFSRAARLRQSILRRAFAGHLVEQEEDIPAQNIRQEARTTSQPLLFDL